MFRRRRYRNTSTSKEETDQHPATSHAMNTAKNGDAKPLKTASGTDQKQPSAYTYANNKQSGWNKSTSSKQVSNERKPLRKIAFGSTVDSANSSCKQTTNRSYSRFINSSNAVRNQKSHANITDLKESDKR